MAPNGTTYRCTLWIVACAAVLVLLAQPQSAHGIASNNRHQVIATPAGAGTYATYVIGPYDVANGETITKVAVTFPAACNVSAAQPVDSGDSVTVSGQTVTVTFGTPHAAGSRFTFRIGNIRNPTTAGKFTLANPVVFTRSNGTTVNVNLLGKRGQFTIFTSPYLVVTIETPDDTQTVDFGSVDPGTAAPSRTVTVTVDSSLAFTISRSLTGDVALMGLTVSALPAAVQTAGVRTYSCVYGLTPPWTTDPAVPLQAGTQYTVTQQ